jgi:FkbM family methyltransferase
MKSIRSLLKLIRRILIHKKIVYIKLPENGIKEEQKDYFSIQTPVAKLDSSGFFMIPENKKHVHIDVGLSINAPNLVSVLNRRKDVFAIGVEPNPEHYFGLLSLPEIKKSPWILGWDQESIITEIEKRKTIGNLDPIFLENVDETLIDKNYGDDLIILPAAVAVEEGHTRLWKHSHSGSSSLDREWADTNEFFYCATITLESIIRRIPKRYEWISHLKIDAEGFDMEVLRSAGAELSRIAIVTIETPAEKEMRALGFVELLEQPGGISYKNKDFDISDHEIDFRIRV